MIPVQAQAEPPDFQKKVREKGRKHLVANPVQPPVAPKYWTKREYWRDSLGDLRTRYASMYAFSAIRICPVTGAGSVEHFKPRSKHPDHAYEWANFRLVCNRMNGRKQDHEDVIDPFDLPEDVFELNPVSGGIFVHP